MNLRAPTLRVTQRVFLWLGAVALAYAGGTVAYAGLYQRYQAWKFDGRVAAARVRLAVPAAVADPAVDPREGDVIGRLEMPRIGISVMVLQGVDAGTLIAGAGHVPGTAWPGADGNMAITAHRDTFFRKMEGIRSGDAIRVATVHGLYDYIVESTEVVDPDAVQVLESHGRRELTLITCYPFYFVGPAPRRFIVHARAAK